MNQDAAIAERHTPTQTRGGDSCPAACYPANTVTIINGDCRTALKEVPSESVQCVVTSPPYWGLRDYGHAEQIGQEQTPQDFVKSIVEVFEEIRRVLKDDGTVWLNLGDSYAAQRGGTAMPAETLAGGVNGKGDADAHRGRRSTKELGGRQDESSPEIRTYAVAHRNARAFGLKHKDLIGIPWRCALALQDAGWYLRSEITWCKKACMPESVTDRPTSATEKIFLLTKSDRYYYDADAVKERTVTFDDSTRDRDTTKLNNTPGRTKSAGLKTNQYATRNMRNFWLLGPEPCRDAHFAVYPSEIPRRAILAGSKPGDVILDPFGGSGTTGMVALELGRRAVLVELNPDYAKLCKQRCTTTPGLPLAG